MHTLRYIRGWNSDFLDIQQLNTYKQSRKMTGLLHKLTGSLSITTTDATNELSKLLVSLPLSVGLPDYVQLGFGEKHLSDESQVLIVDICSVQELEQYVGTQLKVFALCYNEVADALQRVCAASGCSTAGRKDLQVKIT